MAGVVDGQALVEHAKIRFQINQMAKYKQAYYAFKLEYNSIPGDIDRASQYWKGAVDGNGDGRIGKAAYADDQDGTLLMQDLLV